MILQEHIEQVADPASLNPIRLESHQFSEGMAALMWESNKYGRSKYHRCDPFVKGIFMYHQEIDELGWGLS